MILEKKILISEIYNYDLLYFPPLSYSSFFSFYSFLENSEEEEEKGKKLQKGKKCKRPQLLILKFLSFLWYHSLADYPRFSPWLEAALAADSRGIAAFSLQIEPYLDISADSLPCSSSSSRFDRTASWKLNWVIILDMLCLDFCFTVILLSMQRCLKNTA